MTWSYQYHDNQPLCHHRSGDEAKSYRKGSGDRPYDG